MSITMNIQEAKARLSYLISEAEKGNEVTIARAGTPVVRLVPAEAPTKRRFDIFPMELTPEAIEESMAPLSDEELALWYKEEL